MRTTAFPNANAGINGAQAEIEREVERADDADHAERYALRDATIAVFVDQRLLKDARAQLVDDLGELRYGEVDLDISFRRDGARFAHEPPNEVLAVLDEPVLRFLENRGALFSRGRRPAGLRASCTLRSRRDIARRGDSERSQGLAGRFVCNRNDARASHAPAARKDFLLPIDILEPLRSRRDGHVI